MGGAVIIEGSCGDPGYPPEDEEYPAPGYDDAQATVDPFVPIFEDDPCNPHEDTASECAQSGYILIPISPGDPIEPGDPVDVQPITVRDVETFAPDGPHIVVDPDGWGLVGRTVTVTTDSSEQTTTGEILNMPVTIVWVPVSLTVNYGDGTSSTIYFANASHSEHSYSDTGDYVISASIEYAPRVHINGVEVIVPGTVSVATSDAAISIYWVRTRLTDIP